MATGNDHRVTQESIDQENEPHALFAGGYLQDEWKILPPVNHQLRRAV